MLNSNFESRTMHIINSWNDSNRIICFFPHCTWQTIAECHSGFVTLYEHDVFGPPHTSLRGTPDISLRGTTDNSPPPTLDPSFWQGGATVVYDGATVVSVLLINKQWKQILENRNCFTGLYSTNCISIVCVRQKRLDRKDTSSFIHYLACQVGYFVIYLLIVI